MGSAVLGEAIGAIRDWSVSASKQPRAHGTATADRSAAWCSTTRCSRRGCRSRCIRRCAARSRTASARSVGRRRGRARDEGLGRRARRDALHALVPAAHRHHRREARLVSDADRRRQGGPRVLGQGADQGRARRVELPVGRHALHLRGARLHGVGSDEPAVAALQRRRGDAGHPDGVRQLDRRRRSTRRRRSCARWKRSPSRRSAC